MRVRSLMVLIIATAAAACADHPSAVSSAAQPSRDIVDGAHGGGNPFFYFLPPLVSNPGPGANATGLSPAVDICVLSGGACGASLAHFTTDAGTTTTQPGNSETVRASMGGYIVDWHTANFPLEIGGVYRICVSVGSVSLGYVDVDVVGSGKDLKSVDTDAFVGLVNGRTLPIKFRIEDGATDDPPVAGCGGDDGGAE